MKAIRGLSVMAAVETLLVIVAGKIVRVTGASTSIPDWPLAFGQLVPEMDTLALYEWLHRALVLLTALTVLAMTIVAARRPGRLWAYCVLCLALLVSTAVLGGLAVLHGLPLLLAALDQASAMLFFASLVGLAVWSHMVKVDRL